MMATSKQDLPREYPDARRNKPTRSNARTSGLRRHAKRIAFYARLRAVFVRPRGPNSCSHFPRTPGRIRRCDSVRSAVSAACAAPLSESRPVTLLHLNRCREVLAQQSAIHFRAVETYLIGEVQ